MKTGMDKNISTSSNIDLLISIGMSRERASSNPSSDT